MLAKEAGFNKIGEKIVEHRSRKYGVTKYGFDRFIKGYLDLLTIGFITRFGKSPMHLFGSLGSLMFLIGFGMAGFLGIQKTSIYISSSESSSCYRQPFFLYCSYSYDYRFVPFPYRLSGRTYQQKFFGTKQLSD